MLVEEYEEISRAVLSISISAVLEYERRLNSAMSEAILLILASSLLDIAYFGLNISRRILDEN